MDSTAKPTPAGADDPLLARDDTKANSDYERVVREELARVQERLAQLASAGKAAAASPEVKIEPAASDATGSSAKNLDANVTAFRAADISAIEGGRSSRKRGATRFLTGVLLAGTIVGAGAAWASYGNAVKPLVASWMPQINDTWSQVSERLGLTGEQSAAPAPTAATDAAAPPATPPEVTASQAVAPPAAAPAAVPAPAVAPVAAPASGDVGQMLQDMARDIAGLQQGIEQLKAGQEQMARDNAKLAEQLKAGQEQLTRVMARAAEQSLHPRPPLPAPPKPLATAARRPVPAPVSTLPPPQAIAPPPQAAAAPAQLQADDSFPSAPRPPKPVP